MTVFGAIASVVTRKVNNFVSDVRSIVNAAKAEEQKIVGLAKVEVKAIEQRVVNETTKIHNSLIYRIEQL